VGKVQFKEKKKKKKGSSFVLLYAKAKGNSVGLKKILISIGNSWGQRVGGENHRQVDQRLRSNPPTQTRDRGGRLYQEALKETSGGGMRVKTLTGKEKKKYESV